MILSKVFKEKVLGYNKHIPQFKKEASVQEVNNRKYTENRGECDKMYMSSCKKKWRCRRKVCSENLGSRHLGQKQKKHKVIPSLKMYFIKYRSPKVFESALKKVDFRGQKHFDLLEMFIFEYMLKNAYLKNKKHLKVFFIILT